MKNRNLLFTILGLLLIIPIGYATAGLIIDPTHSSSVVDVRQSADSGFTGLHGPSDVKVFYNGTNPYAIVTALDDDKITIVDLSDPLNPKQLGTESDSLAGVGVMAMAQPRAVQVWENATHGYFAAIASQSNDGVQILDLGDPSDIGTNSRSIYNATGVSPAGSTGGGTFESHAARATTGHFDSLNVMNQATDIALINNGTTASPAYYVAVAGFLGDGIQIYDARDVGDEGGHFQIAGNASDTQGVGTGGHWTGRLVLDGVSGIDTFTYPNATQSSTADQTYIIAAAFVDDGVQVINVADPFKPVPGTNTTKAASGFANLESATDVATWDHAGTPYAIVTSSANDAVTVIDLSGATISGCTPDRNQPGGATCLKATDSLTDSQGDLALDGANRVEIVQVGADSRNYAIVTANATDAGGIQIIDLYDPYNIQPVDRLFGNSTHAGTRGGWGLDTFTLGDDTYVVVANYEDDAIQVIKLTGLETGKGNAAVCGISADCSAPTINRNSDGATDDGFSVNGKNMPAVDRFNDVDGADARVGNLVTVTARIYDAYGSSEVEKANLYFDMQGTADWTYANAAVKYDVKRNEVSTIDNNDIFDVDVSQKEVGDRLEVTFKIMFTDSMDTSHIGLQSVDKSRNYQMIYFRDALTVTGQSTSTQTSAEIEPEVTQTVATVPDWVKNTAGWWAEGAISEGEFVRGVEYLIQQQIIDTDAQTTSSEGTSSSVPDWVKNTAGWWAEGAISEGEFVNAIEHLVKTGTIIII